MFGGAKSSIKPVSQKTRTERIAAAKPPTPLPSRLALQSNSAKRSLDSARSSPAKVRSSRSPATPDRLDIPSGNRKAQRVKSPGEQKPNFGEESDDEDADADARSRSSGSSNKRQKVEVTPTVDTKRQLRSKRAFSDDDHGAFPMIHAADIASPVRKSKLPDLQEDKVTVELKYPSASQHERYCRSRFQRWRG